MPYDKDNVSERNRVRARALDALGNPTADLPPTYAGRIEACPLPGTEPVDFDTFKREARARFYAERLGDAWGTAELDAANSEWPSIEGGLYDLWVRNFEWYALAMDGTLLRAEPFVYPASCRDEKVFNTLVDPDGNTREVPALNPDEEAGKNPKRVATRWLIHRTGRAVTRIPVPVRFKTDARAEILKRITE